MTIVKALKIPNQIQFGLENSLTNANALNLEPIPVLIFNISFKKGKTLKHTYFPISLFYMPAFSRQQGLNMYSKVLLRLLLREYMSKWLTMSILAKSDALEEQRFKAYFEVNIFDKEKADEFVKIFGKWMD